jgi:hypothetical protein
MKISELITQLINGFYAVEEEKEMTGIFNSVNAHKAVHAYRIKLIDVVDNKALPRQIDFIVKDEGELTEEVYLTKNAVTPTSYNTFHKELITYLNTNPISLKSYSIREVNYAEEYSIIVGHVSGTDITETLYYISKDVQDKFQYSKYVPYIIP